MFSVAVLLAGCSSRSPDVQTGPRTGENASTAARFAIPPGHLPPPGMCKVWMPGEPPGQQKKKYRAGNCSVIERQVPRGGWLVYNLNGDKKQVVVREYGVRSPGVIAIRAFDLVTGALLWEETPAGDR